MDSNAITLVDVLNWALPPVSLLLWLSAYVVYFWRQQEIRDWLARHLHGRGRRPRHPAIRPGGAMPVLFRPPPPPPPAPIQTPRAAMITTAAGPDGVAVTRLAEWRVGHLPLRYRLLGQVRRADNDN